MFGGAFPILPHPTFSFRISPAIVRSLIFMNCGHYKKKKKNPVGILMEIALNLKIDWGKINILLLSLLNLAKNNVIVFILLKSSFMPLHRILKFSS